jgi:cell division protein FtsI (penicillin-binding protein 3)
MLVKKVTDGTGNTVTEAATVVRREAISPNVARIVSEMLVAVTEGEGTGVEAAVPGFRTAGKTATAQKADPATGKYSSDHFTASFVGFVPADNPRVAIAVVLDEPMITHAGGSVAAPVFRRVAAMSLRYMGVTPHGSAAAPISQLGQEQDPAQLTYNAMQSASAGPPAAPVVHAAASSSAVAPPGSKPVVDLAGMPAAAALKAVMEQGFIPRISGTGKVIRQEPVAGTPLEPGASVTLYLEPST